MNVPYIRKSSACACVVLCILSLGAFGQEGRQRTQPPKPRIRPTAVEGEYIIVLRSGAEVKQVAAKIAPANSKVEVKNVFENINSFHIRIDEAKKDSQNLLSNAAKNPNIESIQPNYIHYPLQTKPNDPRLKDQWHLKQIAAYSETKKAAWDIRHESPNIIVAVIDSGIFLKHEDLENNLWVNTQEKANGEDDDGNNLNDDIHGYDFVNDKGEPEAEPEEILLYGLFPTGRLEYQKHGSHVAGIIGAVGNNMPAKGVSGVSWKVQIMALKFFGGPSPDGFIGHGGGSTADAIRAINYAIDKGAHIINASWGNTFYEPALQRAIERSNAAGILFVAAAGNGGPDGKGDNNDNQSYYPASYEVPNVVAVAATDRNDDLTSFSNFGQASVDLAAPGLNILSTVPGGDWAKEAPQPAPQQSYETMSGTSMATPVVVGATALIKAGNTGLSPQEIRTILIRTVDEKQSLSGKVASGGRLNLEKVLNPPIPDFTAFRPDNVPQDRVDALNKFLESFTPEQRTNLILQQIPIMNAPSRSQPDDASRSQGGERGASNSKGGKKTLLIGFEGGGNPTKENFATSLKDHGIEGISILGMDRLAPGEFEVFIDARVSSEDAAKSIGKIPGVLYAQPNRRQNPQSR